MAAVLEQEISSLITKQAIEEVSHLHCLGFYGRIFVVPKASGGWRPVLDLLTLNLYLRRIHFCMETTLSILDAIQQGDWAASLDMTEAFFHILMHPKDRKWLRFVWERRSFQFRALPFGLSLCLCGCSPASPDSWLSIYTLGACASGHTSTTG